MARVWVRKSGRKDRDGSRCIRSTRIFSELVYRQCLGKDNVPNVDSRVRVRNSGNNDQAPVASTAARLHQCCVACAFYASATVL